MPNLDLEPHQYSDRDPKTGKWKRPISKRAARNWFAFAAVFLVALFFARTSSASEFGLTAMVAFFAGVFAQQWLRDLY